MYARKLEPNEIYLSRRNMAVAFDGEFDFEKELEKSKTEQADPSGDHWGAFLGSPQDPVASIVMNKMDVRFDGRLVKMGGVGGVATLPGYRRGGAIRACMEASHRALYDEGFVLSALYPFSTAYYSQFGYENGAPSYAWTIPVSDLPKADVGGRVCQLLPGDDLSPLLDVYNKCFQEVNLSALRKEYSRELRETNFLNQRRSIFVWEDENGTPAAFLIGGRKEETLNCRTDFSEKNGLLFTSARSLLGLLSFVRTAFAANFEKLYFVTPAFADISPLLPETTGVECKMFPNGMVRVVNVEKALRLCRCRETRSFGEGCVTVKVLDPMLAENDGVFRVSFAPGKENIVEKGDFTPDVVLPIGRFSALLCGVRGMEDVPFMTGVELKNPAAALECLFYKKPCYMLNLF